MNATKAALLDLAEDITQTKSFANVSFQALAEGAGIKKGSVYYHFKSKEELGDAIIERATTQLIHGLRDIKEQPVLKQLHVYTNWFKDHIGASQKLCPGANFVASWDSVAAPTKTLVKKLYQAHKDGLVSIIRNGRNTGEFTSNDTSPEDLATAVFSLMQGGLIASRVSDNIRDFEQCKSVAIRLVQSG